MTETDGDLFVYVDGAYNRDTITVDLESGEQVTLNVQERKGGLIIEKKSTYK